MEPYGQDRLTHISLFSGIGGDTLAAQWAGFETVLFVENDKFCQKVLNKHWSDVPIIGDIKDVTKETMENARCRNTRQCGKSHQEPDERNSKERPTSQVGRPSGKPYANELTAAHFSPITLITGGFPCQPVSVAGKQRGKEDDRWLWPEMFRVIKEVRPTWVVAENVGGLIRMGIDDCISSDLENIGYTTESYIIPACAVNAPHRRDRVFIVAYANKCQRQSSSTQSDKWSIKRASQDVANTKGIRTQRGRTTREQEPGTHGRTKLPVCRGSRSGADQWAVEPNVGRVAYGIPSRVDRLKALGNAIVPQQIYPILKAIADLELKV